MPARSIQLLASYNAVSLLQPAVVLKVADTTATVHVRGNGEARINWDGISWAKPRRKDGSTGANPRKAGEVLKVGEVVYVISDKRGTAQLSQLPDAQSALVALDPQDGAVVSMVGGFDYYSNKFNRVTQAKRQPGSGFKPFLYSAALEEGFTPASVILDMPVILEGGENEENWRPENSGGEFGGPMRLREALVRSRNLVSIRILQHIGVNAAIEHAGKFGFNKESLPRNLTMALGTQVTTPMEMATGFATFANGGFKVSPYFISRIEDSTGKVIFEANPAIACSACEERTADAEAPAEAAPKSFTADAPEALQRLAQLQGGRGYLPAKRLAPRVLSAQNAWLMTDIMQDVAQRGTAVRTRVLGRNDLAGKTGTTQENRDNWFNGFNGQLVASVWVGHDNEQSLGRAEEGSSTAVPIWIHFMREALRGVPANSLARPSGLVDLKVSPFMGTLADPLDPNAIYETFMIQHQPKMPEPGDPFAGPFGGAEGGAEGTGGGEPLF